MTGQPPDGACSPRRPSSPATTHSSLWCRGGHSRRHAISRPRRGIASRIRSVLSARSLARAVNGENPGLFVYAPDGGAWGEGSVGELVEEIAAPMLLIRAPTAP